jgi:hypothetical protein
MGHRLAKQRAPRSKRKRIAHVPGFTNEFAVAEEPASRFERCAVCGNGVRGRLT